MSSSSRSFIDAADHRRMTRSQQTRRLFGADPQAATPLRGSRCALREANRRRQTLSVRSTVPLPSMACRRSARCWSIGLGLTEHVPDRHSLRHVSMQHQRRFECCERHLVQPHRAQQRMLAQRIDSGLLAEDQTRLAVRPAVCRRCRSPDRRRPTAHRRNSVQCCLACSWSKPLPRSATTRSPCSRASPASSSMLVSAVKPIVRKLL